MRLILATLPIVLLSLHLLFFGAKAWQIFVNECPNNDFLSWDENLRLNTVLDQFADYRDGHWFRATLPFFESPTWPPLRSFTTFVSLYLPLSNSITERDSFQGLLFFLLVFPSLVYIFSRIHRDWLVGSLIGLFVCILSLHTTEIPVYALTSMLETQSMFFLVWSCYALYNLFLDEDRGILRDKTGFLVFFGLFGFYFTKYPYGILLFLSTFLISILRNPNKFKSALQNIFASYLNWSRRIFFGIVFFAISSLPVLRLFGSINLNQKPVKQALFYGSFLVFLDLSLFFWRKKKEVVHWFPLSTQVLWKYAYLPALVWLYMNPDRIGSLIDAQLIVNQYTKSFYATLWTDPGSQAGIPGVFDFVWSFRILVVIGILISFLLRNQLKTILWVFACVIVELLLLEITTGNKQPRHVLQFVPIYLAILISISFFGITKLKSIPQRLFAMVLLIGISVLPGFLNRGLYGNGYFESRPFCYRGLDKTVFDPAREISTQVQYNKRYIILNLFHKKEKYETRGRGIASDFDLAIKLKTHGLGVAKNDHPRIWKSWTEFDAILLISDTCPDKYTDQWFEDRVKNTNSLVRLVNTFRDSQQISCLQTYEVIKNP